MALDPAVRDTIAQRFPGALAYLNNPEVSALLEKAVAEEWAPETFQANLINTNWYRHTNDAQRVAYSLEQTNPGEATARVNDLKQQISTFLYQLGAPQMSDADLGAHAWQAFREGWSPTDLKTNIASFAAPSTTSTNATNIRQMASQYMINLTDDKVTDLSRRVFTGQLDAAGLQSMFQAQAAGQFPALADQIAKGVTPHDYFDPYVQLISKYTDTPSAQVSLTDPTWNKIVSYADPNGKLRPMTIDEATTYIRGTDQFANSTTGQQETASYVNQFEKMLGVRR